MAVLQCVQPLLVKELALGDAGLPVQEPVRTMVVRV